MMFCCITGERKEKTSSVGPADDVTTGTRGREKEWYIPVERWTL